MGELSFPVCQRGIHCFRDRIMAILLLAGATGLVGSAVLRLALADSRVGRVIAPTRRALQPHSRLENPIGDYGTFSGDEPWWRVDAVVCALGTTIKQAGSQDSFRKVDHDYPLLVAKHALMNGARSYALKSSIGADPGSGTFYLRTKGEVERDLEECGFPSLTIVRPSVIDGQREDFRFGEKLAIIALKAFRPLVPRRYREVPAGRIAMALLESALAAVPGRHVLESEEL